MSDMEDWYEEGEGDASDDNASQGERELRETPSSSDSPNIKSIMMIFECSYIRVIILW